MLVRFWCNTNDELEVEVEILKWVNVLQVVPVKLSQNRCFSRYTHVVAATRVESNVLMF